MPGDRTRIHLSRSCLALAHASFLMSSRLGPGCACRGPKPRGIIRMEGISHRVDGSLTLEMVTAASCRERACSTSLSPLPSWGWPARKPRPSGHSRTAATCSRRALQDAPRRGDVRGGPEGLRGPHRCIPGKIPEGLRSHGSRHPLARASGRATACRDDRTGAPRRESAPCRGPAWPVVD